MSEQINIKNNNTSAVTFFFLVPSPCLQVSLKKIIVLWLYMVFDLNLFKCIQLHTD